MIFSRLASVLIGLCGALVPLVVPAAQDYPSRSVRIIVPYAPGGVLDVTARSLAVPLAKALGQSVIVENKPGAGGNIGSELVARSDPDGYTILMLTDANAIAPSLYHNLSYDPLSDFAPVTLLASGSHVVVAHPSLPVSNIAELIKYAMAHPGKLAYASPGTGTAQHLAGEMLKSAAGGLPITHVPYKGGGQAINDVVGGQVQLAVLGLAPALPQIRAGKLKALAVTGTSRVDVLPGVPTLEEAGLAGVETTQWLGAVVPAGTPQPIVAKLHAAFLHAMNAPSVRALAARIGLNVTTSPSPPQFADFIRREVQRWPPIVKSAGATAG